VRAFEFPSRLDIFWTDAIGEPALVVNTAGIVVSCNKQPGRRTSLRGRGSRLSADWRTHLYGGLPARPGVGRPVRTARCGDARAGDGPALRAPARGSSPPSGPRHTRALVGRAARLQAVGRIAAEQPGARHMVHGGEPSGQSPGLSASSRRYRSLVVGGFGAG
jgi:hypothetical protein